MNDDQTRSAWRELSPAERSLVITWLDHWNDRSGDAATLQPDALARSSCDCGTCPSFAVRPLALNAARGSISTPYLGEGHATMTNGAGPGLLVWGLSPDLARDEVDFEIYSVDGDPVALEGLRFRFDD